MGKQKRRKRKRAAGEYRPPADRSMAIKRMEGFPRMFAGYWSTLELAGLLGVEIGTINMHVSRGKLAPVRRLHGQTNLFTDGEVWKYLNSPPGKRGRPRKSERAAEPSTVGGTRDGANAGQE
jgi:hypothetical protein